MTLSKENDRDLGSFEEKYPKHLFNKSVYANDGQTLIGYVAKETDDLIVVFSDSDSSSRFDIPKSITALSGNSIIIKSDTVDSLKTYKIARDLPLPQDRTELRKLREKIEEPPVSPEQA